MYLFVSDMHFGRQDPAAERKLEQALIRCLRTYEDDVEGLYLMGDVFDQYIEYRHLVPKGFVRFQALLADWADRGTSLTYFAGNHDPWHHDYFETELGVQLQYDPVVEQLPGIARLPGRAAYLAHGDSVDTTARLYRWLRPVLRHPLPVTLYKYLLPGDTGFGLARWVNQHLHGEAVDATRARALRRHAYHILSETQVGLAVLAHSHQAELINWSEGVYLNTGSWRLRHTFGLVDNCRVQLLRWNGSRADIIESADLA